MWPVTNMQLTNLGDNGLKVLRKTETRFMSIPEEKYVVSRSLSNFALRSINWQRQLISQSTKTFTISEQLCVGQFRKRILKIQGD